MTRIIAMLLALSLARCSLFMRTNPEGWKPSRKPTCTASRVAPAGDLIAALPGYLLLGFVALASSNHPYGGTNDDTWEVKGTLGLILGYTLVFTSAAVYGGSKARRCREAFSLHREWRAQKERAARQEEQERRREKRRPPKPGELGGYCIGDETCTGNLMCDHETTRCVPAAP